MNLYGDSAWFGQVRRMRRSDPIYKPAMLLVAMDLIDEGLGTPEHVPLGILTERFEELLVRSSLASSRAGGRAYMPAYHLSTSSKTEEPFWTLAHEGGLLGRQEEPGSTRALLRDAGAVRFDEVLADELGAPDGTALARASIYQLLEDDGREDCLKLLAAHDVDKAAVDEGVQVLRQLEATVFQLDDPNARKVRTVREHMRRDRTFRRAVLPAYDFSCALCSTRIRWNNFSEVEATHIKPRAYRGADDPRNALSLCQTHHWAFDLGLWSADDDLLVLVGDPVEPRGDDLAAIRQFQGQPLRAPIRASARPHPDALRWHRRRHGFDRAA